MNETKRPREFWIKATRVRNGVKSYTATLAPISVAGEIHVIEKSEYDDLKDRYDLVVDSDNAWREKAEALEEKLRVAIEALDKLEAGYAGMFGYESVSSEKEAWIMTPMIIKELLSKLKGG